MDPNSPDKSPLPTPNDGRTIESQKIRLDADGKAEDLSNPKPKEPTKPGINPLGVPNSTLECRPDDPMFAAVIANVDNEARAGHAAQQAANSRTWQQALRELQQRLTKKQWFNARSNSPSHQHRKASKNKGDDGHER